MWDLFLFIKSLDDHKDSIPCKVKDKESMLKITLYGRSVRLETQDRFIIRHIENFIDKFYKDRQRSFNPNVPAPDKVYGSILANGTLIYLHTNQFQHMRHYFKENNISIEPYEIIDKRQYDIEPSKVIIKSQWELRDYQEPIYDFVTTSNHSSMLIPIQTGKGKLSPLYSKIKVPGGWSTMGEMKVGTVVTAWDGKPAVVNGVFPQGKKAVFKITFKDGRSTGCGAEHLWKVYCVNAESHERWRVINTLEVWRLISMPNSRVYVPLCKHEECEDIDLPIHPYELGSLIGEYYNYDTLVSYQGEYSETIQKLKELGLTDINHSQMFIPAIYLQATSRQQKLELIDGLMDQTGILRSYDWITFDTISETLAKDVQYLIRSIGGLATLRDDPDTSPVIYTLDIDHPNPLELFCQPKRKFSISNKWYFPKDLKLEIKSIAYIGEEETQCISIDHPDHLYVTDDFIVTHNTLSSLYSIAYFQQRLGIVILPQFIEKWILDLTNIYVTSKEDILVIQGQKSIRSVINYAREGELKAKYIIFASRTLSDFIKCYEDDQALCKEMYDCEPIELFSILGIGTLLIDESHMHFHAMFRIIIHTNVKRLIGLTATLMTENPVIKRVHEIVYPQKGRYQGGEIDKYIDVYAISYSINSSYLRFIRTTAYNNPNYNHIVFEQSLMKRKEVFNSFIKVIHTTIEDYFMEDYKPGDKLLVLVASVKLATKVTHLLKGFYPQFNIQRYVEEDNYDDLMQADVAVSNILSAGTGFDIPNLRVVIQTISISSPTANLQSLGRLRKLPDRDVKFCYLYSSNIPKQIEYHNKRLDLFKDYSAGVISRQSRCHIY